MCGKIIFRVVYLKQNSKRTFFFNKRIQIIFIHKYLFLRFAKTPSFFSRSVPSLSQIDPTNVAASKYNNVLAAETLTLNCL